MREIKRVSMNETITQSSIEEALLQCDKEGSYILEVGNLLMFQKARTILGRIIMQNSFDDYFVPLPISIKLNEELGKYAWQIGNDKVLVYSKGDSSLVESA